MSKWNDSICIEINIHRTVIDNNIVRYYTWKKRKENRHFWRCVFVLWLILDMCESFGVLTTSIFKNKCFYMLGNHLFTPTLMLELMLGFCFKVNHCFHIIISYLIVLYLTGKWWVLRQSPICWRTSITCIHMTAFTYENYMI